MKENGMEILLSITIVAYKNYDEVCNAVASIEKYTSAHISKKIYIVDNSAWDEPEKKRFVQKMSEYPDVEYLDMKKNVGFGKGHNAVIKYLNSKYHAIVNPDILLKEDSFYRILSYMKENLNVGMVIPKLIDQSEKILPVYRREITVWDMLLRMFLKKFDRKRQAYHTMQDMDYDQPFEVPFGQGSFLVIRTSLFRKLNGFDDRYFMYMEDADLCKRVNQVSKLMYYPDTAVIHKWEKGSHKNLRLMYYHSISMMKYFWKWKVRWK